MHYEFKLVIYFDLRNCVVRDRWATENDLNLKQGVGINFVEERHIDSGILHHVDIRMPWGDRDA